MTLFPEKAKTADFLHHYAAQFQTIELNTTFYRIPDPSSVSKWKDAVPADFRFCPKVYQDISHRKALFGISPLLETFITAIRGFGNNLGCCFLQLPPDFGPALLPRLENFIRMWPKDISLAVEFRHEGWFDQSPLAESGFALLESAGVSTVITDVAGRRDVLHMHLTAPTVLVRLVGNSLNASDFTRLDAWSTRLDQWFQKGLKEVHLFLHQPDPLLIPEFASWMIQRNNALASVKIKEIIRFDQKPPEQPTLF